MKHIVTLGWVLIAVLIAGCASDGGGAADSRPMLTGTINYRAKIALSSSAVMTVRLLDITRKDVPAIVLGEKSVSNPGTPPIAFSLSYPFGGFAANRSYVIDARIEVDGRLRFYSMKQHVVTPQNAAETHELWLDLSGD